MQEKVLTQKEREEEEMGNAMKALENRTLESKREMDIMAALDEMRTLKARQSQVICTLCRCNSWPPDRVQLSAHFSTCTAQACLVMH